MIGFTLYQSKVIGKALSVNRCIWDNVHSLKTFVPHYRKPNVHSSTFASCQHPNSILKDQKSLNFAKDQ